MYAGVILHENGMSYIDVCVPRVCGGDPSVDISLHGGYFVFPVYAGVILMADKFTREEDSVPRVCGGDPFLYSRRCSEVSCSPCVRGYYGFIMITIWNINEVYGLNISFLIILLRS